jgi:2',3'-cyclic-nucleotide 2'-phosphodiesterase (5'-nucleotidase family)
VTDMRLATPDARLETSPDPRLGTRDFGRLATPDARLATSPRPATRDSRLLFFLLLLVSCSKPASPSPSLSASKSLAPNRVVILHMGDLHGRVDRLPALSSYITSQRKRGQVLLVDSGDFFQGTPEGDLTDGRVVIDAYNALGVDAVVPGNHDFDRGPAVTEALARQARFPFLAANVRSGRGPPGWVRPSLVFSELRIEILGLAPDTMDRLSTRRAREGLEFTSGAKALAAHAWTPGVARILLTHLGIERDRDLPLRGVAAVLGGHTHVASVETLATKTILMHPGSHGTSIGRLELELDPGTGAVRSARGELVEIPEGRDAAMEHLIETHAGDVRRLMEKHVGILKEDLPRGGPDFDGVSSPLGNWLADMARGDARTEAAILLRSSIRSSLLQGPLRMRDLYLALPFRDTIVAVHVTGAQLRNALERAVAGEDRLLVEVSGIEMAYDRGRPSGRRIVRLELNGRPVEPKCTYRIATLSFMVETGGLLSSGTEVRDTGATLFGAATVYFVERSAVQPPKFTPRIRKIGRK